MTAALPGTAEAICFGQAPTISGTPAGEPLVGTPGDDVIEGGGGNDIIDGGGGADRICGEGDDDTINGQAGNDQLDGGTNATSGDTVTFVDITVGQGPSLTIDLVAGTAIGTNPINTTDTLAGFENVTGSSTFDSIFGDAGPNVLRGLSAADGFTGRGGDDTLIDDTDNPSNQDTAIYLDATGPVDANATVGTVVATGLGTDTLVGVTSLEGGAFDDHLVGDDTVLMGGSPANSLVGRGGNDLIEPGRGVDFVTGGGDPGDRVTYENDDAVVVNLPGSSATTATGTDIVTGIRNVTGSPADDTITGNTNPNDFDGLGGGDTMDGGGGIDTASFSTLALAVNASLAAGTSTGQGVDGLSGFENLVGSAQGDTLIGDGGPNLLSGGSGADSISGGLDQDTMLLGAGLDAITANDGVVDTIDCTGGGPDSGSVDGPAPAETYTGGCNSDADALVDFLDLCPAQPAATSGGCPVGQPPPPAPAPKKCKKKKAKRAGAAAKQCKKKRK